ncbi:7458_t:CDS:1, partial [Dentiscutata erythropus]
EKENFFHPNDSIVLKQAKFEINNCIYNINYGKIDKQLVELQTQAIVKSIDRSQISQEAYRSLARLDELLI